MSETPTTTPEPAGQPAAAAPQAEAPPEAPRPKGTLQELLEAGAHFGHQTRRWNPQMKKFIFGARNGIHIIDLDQTMPRLEIGLEFLREVVANGGKVLMVATKRQAQEPVKAEALRAGQYYVNNRWLGGMLTNFRTVKRSIEVYKEQIATVADEEKTAELSKKDLSRLNRSIAKYTKSLEGLKEMQKLPDAMFVIDINKEHLAIAEANRLGIPVVAIVDSNCSPNGIDFPIPANDDAIRAIQLYCALVSDACAEGAALHNERIVSQDTAAGVAEGTGTPGGRRIVEIQQPGAGGGGGGGGPRGNRNDGARGGRRPRQAGGSFSAGRDDSDVAVVSKPVPAPAASEPAAPAAEAAKPAVPESGPATDAGDAPAES